MPLSSQYADRMADGTAENSPGLAAGFRNGEVSYWFRDAGLPTRRAALPGSVTADVAIAGAGMSGLWVAYYLKRARPELSVVVVEKEFAGFGASGRNGGWLSGELPGFARRYAAARGAASVASFQRQMFAAVDEVLAIAEAEGIEADQAKDGVVRAAVTEAQLARVRRHFDAHGAQLGWGRGDLVWLDPAELARRVTVAGALGGTWTPHCARLHPAKFVTGLAAAVERLGVAIHEGTTVTRISSGALGTDQGTVRAPVVIRALEGYTDTVAGERRRLLPMNSSMVVTEVLPEAVWEQIGWRGAELLSDAGHAYAYLQRTADRRIAIGGRGVPYNYASSFDRQGRTADKAVGQLRAKLGALFPAVRAHGIEHSWTGVLGVPRDWCASVRWDRATGVGTAGGYTGHGVTSSYLGARTLVDLILDEETERVTLPWVDWSSRRWEPEPLRWTGAAAMYAAYRYADRREATVPRTVLAAKVADRVSGRA
jgi:glycine/D-amino acid oxidase-like deaminating enzyme